MLKFVRQCCVVRLTARGKRNRIDHKHVALVAEAIHRARNAVGGGKIAASAANARIQNGQAHIAINTGDPFRAEEETITRVDPLLEDLCRPFDVVLRNIERCIDIHQHHRTGIAQLCGNGVVDAVRDIRHPECLHCAGLHVERLSPPRVWRIDAVECNRQRVLVARSGLMCSNCGNLVDRRSNRNRRRNGGGRKKRRSRRWRYRRQRAERCW
jgi:hypothetical protein